ncbi:chorismate--pyruvate lyase family protein [Catenovulum agarivorans]|uniref:chorismate--pyruvate lyase family protein n=1 Tax=Catenovulum agarivorans TaxID=1172192 RepID=UPI0002E778E3|nr:chorismate lyase [Catenovulum agarivorans]
MLYSFPLGDGATWLQKVNCNDSVWSWLTDESSLTAKLKSYQSDFSLTVLGQGWQKSQHNNDNYLAREVLLNCAGAAWVYAHTRIPESSLSAQNQFLTQLENKPLGEAIFQLQALKRAAIEFAEYTSQDKLWLFAKAKRSNKNASMPKVLFGRRSTFLVNHLPIYVSEIFLPDSPLYL